MSFPDFEKAISNHDKGIITYNTKSSKPTTTPQPKKSFFSFFRKTNEQLKKNEKNKANELIKTQQKEQKEKEILKIKLAKQKLKELEEELKNQTLTQNIRNKKELQKVNLNYIILENQLKKENNRSLTAMRIRQLYRELNNKSLPDRDKKLKLLEIEGQKRRLNTLAENREKKLVSFIETSKIAEKIKSIMKSYEESTNTNPLKNVIAERNKAIEDGQTTLAKELNEFIVKEQSKKYHNSILSQQKNEENKMKSNAKYILNKLEDTNYDLLYDLINSLASTNSKIRNLNDVILKDKFEKYLSKYPEQKGDIMKILKSVYRLKFNKSIENKKKEIEEKLKSGIKQQNRNQLLVEIKDISSHIDLATGFHDFTQIEYYICNKDQVQYFNDGTNIEDIPLQKIKDLSPIFYANGIFCINPIIGKYTADKESIQNLKQLVNNNSSLLKVTEVDNLNNFPDIVNINECIKNIASFNTKDSLLSKFFEKKILGKATEHGIHEEDKINKNINPYINIPNFESFCAEFLNTIDTIVIVDGGIRKHYTTKYTTKKDKNEKKILTEYFQQQVKMKKGGHMQVGGFDFAFLTPLTFLIFVVSFIVSLRVCYTKKRNGAILKNDYRPCVSNYTWSYVVSGIMATGVIIWLIITQGKGSVPAQGSSFWFEKHMFSVKSDITKNSYAKINNIINIFHKNESKITKRDMKLAAREKYKGDGNKHKNLINDISTLNNSFGFKFKKFFSLYKSKEQKEKESKELITKQKIYKILSNNIETGKETKEKSLNSNKNNNTKNNTTNNTTNE